MALGNVVHRLQVQEARRADLGAVGLVGPVRHQVDAELALGRLDGGVDLACGHVEAFGVQLEMVDQAFHRGLHVGALGRGQLAAGQHVAGGFAQLGNRLADDRGRLAHLFHPAEVAVVTVAVLANRHLEFELVIAFIGLRPAQIPGEAGAAHHDAGEPVLLNVLLGHHTDVAVALLEDAVFGQQAVDIVQHLGEFHRPKVDIIEQLIRQVLMHAAGAEVGRVQARAAGPLVEDHQFFALFKTPQRRGQRADVHRLRGDVEEVVQHPADFRVEHPDQLAAARHLGAGQLLDGQAPGMLLVHRRHVIEAVEIWQVL